MTFDPTTNYGNIDLSVDENLICWKFGELIKNLITLSSDAERQIDIIGFGAVADEMFDDFKTYFTSSSQSYIDNKLLTTDQKEALLTLDHFFDERSYDNYDKDSGFWDSLQLGTHPDWVFVRYQAKQILKLINMEDVLLVFDREEKYVTAENGERFIMQSTKSRLVIRKDS